MLNIIIEHKKTFIALLIISFIIIFVTLWFPKDNSIRKYKKLTNSEIETQSIKNYGDKLQFALYSHDIEFLKEKISSEYLEYTGINLRDYQDWLIENELLTSKVRFQNTTKYEYDDKIIYSIQAIIDNESRTINIIEESPEIWNYSFDNFVSFSSKAKTKTTKEYGAIINNVYQDINYIKFNCSVYVDEGNANNIDISKSDSIHLIMDDGSSLIMANNNYTTDSIIINKKEYITTDCIFNIPINSQTEIKAIVFETFNINNREKSIEVKLDL